MMHDSSYQDFIIHIFDEHTAKGGFYVYAHFPTEDRSERGEFNSPYSEDEITDVLSWMDLGLFDEVKVKEFGEKLFWALFTDPIRELYNGSRQSSDNPLRLRLIIDDPSVARIPWELLYDPKREQFLSLEASLVRSASFSEPTRSIQVEPPLRILVISAFPNGVPKVQSHLEIAGIHQALSERIDQGHIEIETLSHASLRKLQNKLREGDNPANLHPYHILHFIGHGQYNASTGRTVLLFEDETGQIDAVDDEDLVNILNPFDLKLVLLNSCQSIQSSTLDIAQGFAPKLLASGIPAVIGMQTTVLSEIAIKISQYFYEALADNRPIDAALTDARRLVRGTAHRRKADNAIPVCYLRSSTGQVQRVQAPDQSSAVGESWRQLIHPETWRRGLLQWLHKYSTPVGLIGGLVVLFTFVATVVGFYADIGSIFSPDPTPIPPMSGDFNVAVAEFGELDSQGSVQESRTGRALAEDVYITLIGAVQQLQDAGFEIEVRQPSLTGRIEGLDQNERADQAAELATEINADLIIYGILRFSDDATSLIPEFYLSSEKLADAEELGGQYEFGSPLQIPGNIERNPVPGREMREVLTEQARALAQFVIGLGYFALGRFDEAASYFEEAEKAGAWDDETGDEAGKKVLYLFLGSTSALHADLSSAETYYENALHLDSRYSRAQLGAAQIHYLRAKDGCQPDQVNVDGIQAAIDGYEDALKSRHPPLAEIPTKTALLLGRAYFCLSIAQKADHWDDAQSEYEKVIEDFEEDENPRLKNLAAEAFADLGLLHYASAAGDTEVYRRAAESYQQAASLSSHPDRKALFQVWQADIHLLLEECGLADEDLANADENYDKFLRLNPEIQRPGFEKFRRDMQQKRDFLC